jgi:DNA polymerase IIIc chi subunit
VTLTHVVFFQVQSGQQKVQRIVEVAKQSFRNRERLLFFVDDEKAFMFLDDALWKHPQASFLPHGTDPKDLIAITTEKRNINNARIAFNLSSTPLLVEGPFKTIYDFEDVSSKAKEGLAAARYDAYKRLGLSIEAVRS